MKIVSVNQMISVEKSANSSGISYDEMMANAGQGIGHWIYQNVSIKNGLLGLIGSGNNGGDTLIALTWLSKRGFRTTAFLVKPREQDSLIAEYLSQGGQVIDLSSGKNIDFFQAGLVPGVVVLDGILGTGIKLPVQGKLRDIMSNLSSIINNIPGIMVIAVDCPSGVDCDSGEVSDVTIPAEDTLSLAAIKQGLLKHPARSYAGNLHLIEIGIEKFLQEIGDDLPAIITSDLVRTSLPIRPDKAHKGTFGTCLVIAGSIPYTGAAYLTGKAAYYAGCGLVHMAALPEVYHALAGIFIEGIWTNLPALEDNYDPAGIDLLTEEFLKADSLVIGPGWGLSDDNIAFLMALLPAIPRSLPAIFDADGLKLLNQIENWWTLLPEQTILTPHPGEMSVLTGLEINEIQKNRWEIARAYARKWGVVLILKGAVTAIATPEGKVYINATSDSSLATAGSGDVLSGIIGGLLAQGNSAERAAISATYIHALSGVKAHHINYSDVSVTAMDILNYVGPAVGEIKKAVK